MKDVTNKKKDRKPNLVTLSYISTKDSCWFFNYHQRLSLI